MDSFSSPLPLPITNDFGICTVSLGSWKHHSLPGKLQEAAKAGYRAIDLFDEDWAEYLESHGLDPQALWEATEANLNVARKLGDLIKSLGMYVICTQPLRAIEGCKDPAERASRIELATKRFPFMRAFDTDLVFMCSNIRVDSGVTHDFQTIVNDIREVGDRAAEYARKDGGKMIRIGYEGLSWATRNTWSSTWEIVRAVNRPNVGLILDSFNILAVEFANPYNPAGHGRFYPTLEESLDVLCASMAALVATVPADKIYFYQIGDAQLVDPRTFKPPTDGETPRLLPWSRNCRLYPMEQNLGAYMPGDIVTAAVLATGYKGPLSLEVFNKSLHEPDPLVPAVHAKRGYEGLQRLVDAVEKVPRFWTSVAPPSNMRWGARLLRRQKSLRSDGEEVASRI